MKQTPTLKSISIPPPGSSVELSGSIVREIFRGETFAVAVLDFGDDEITVVGNLPSLNAGEHVSIAGKVVDNPKFGLQVHVERITYELPASRDGVERFLSSGLIKGIGPAVAAAIVARFGENALDILDRDPDQYLKVSGIGKKTLSNIVTSWQEHKHSRDLITLLQQHDISINLAARIIKVYGEKASDVIRRNPYQIAYDVSGVGFKRADSLARSLGIGTVDPRRVHAGLYFALHEALSDGHVCLPVETLISDAADLLVIETTLIDWSLQLLSADLQENIIIETVDGLRLAYLKPFFYAERNVAATIHALLSVDGSRLSTIDVDDLQLDPSLSEEQARAVRTALSTPISLITGGPGCGKSYLVKALVDVLDAKGIEYSLAAPTGRAAKRLTESTGQQAYTIHRLLGLNKGEDSTADVEPLSCDVLIIDEMSMVDIILMHKILKACQPGMHLVMVGDADQLPSVGPGNVLHDFIASGLIPVTYLTRIFRQAEGSAIVSAAFDVNRGQVPDLSNESTDFFFFNLPKERISDEVLRLVSKTIPDRFGIASSNIQVLSPMQKGDNGVRELNRLLQNTLNPAQDPASRAIYRAGDRVMQIKNNYDKGVFNGDMGYVSSIDPKSEDADKAVIIEYEGIGHVAYSLDELNEQIVLSYAITIHKSQGGEYPCAVIILSNEHYVMLQRNLLYTAVTRAKQLCILIGSRMAIQMAVSNNNVKRRHSALVSRLQAVGKELEE